MKDVQATKEASIPQKHPALRKMKFINRFLFCWVIFSLLDPDCESGSGFNDPLNEDPIRIHNTAENKYF
jgi:hypothetical protein